MAVLSAVKKIKEPLSLALSSRAESLFIWLCKQFPPMIASFHAPLTPGWYLSPSLAPSCSNPSPPHQPAVTSSKGIPEEMSFAPITGQSGRLREMRVKPKGLISLCDDQGTLIFFFFFFLLVPLKLEGKNSQSQRQMRKFTGGSGFPHKSPWPGKVLLQEFLG